MCVFTPIGMLLKPVRAWSLSPFERISNEHRERRSPSAQHLPQPSNPKPASWPPNPQLCVCVCVWETVWWMAQCFSQGCECSVLRLTDRLAHSLYFYTFPAHISASLPWSKAFFLNQNFTPHSLFDQRPSSLRVWWKTSIFCTHFSFPGCSVSCFL